MGIGDLDPGLGRPRTRVYLRLDINDAPFP